MKKLKLKALELGAKEVLSRAQLKNVLGGAGSGSGSGSGSGTYDQCADECTTDAQCAKGTTCTAVRTSHCGTKTSINICM